MLCKEGLLKTIALLAGFLAFTGLPHTASAQVPPFGRANLRSQFIEAPRAIQQAIDDAGKSAAAGRFAEAVVTLGDLLAREAVAQEDADLAGQDFFLAPEGTRETTNRSLMREAEEVLGGLPAEALEIYELRFGPRATQQVAEATQTRDSKKLREVSRRYFHTKAGYEATFILGMLELQEGRPVAAVSVLRRLASQQLARQRFGDVLLVKLAQAEHLADQQASASEHLIAASLNGIDVKSLVANKEVPAAGQESKWLLENFGQLRADRPSPSDSTLVTGGGASRRGAGDAHMPLSSIRWDAHTTTSQQQNKTLSEFVEGTMNGNPPPPTWQPIVVGNQVLMRTTERMVAVDLQTGKLVWEYPWVTGAEAPREAIGSVDQLGNADAARELLIQRVWNDIPYGRISSDGTRVYMLIDLEELETTAINGVGFGGIQSVRPGDKGTNTLVALEIATEGKLIWTRGRKGKEPVEGGLSDAFFLGPPLPVEGLLYQMAEIAGDTYLLCLEPKTGREVWRQQLLGNEGTSVASDPVRRIGGAMPSYSDGILICPTSASAVVAMDLASRTLLWGTYFPINDGNIAIRGNVRFGSAPDQASLLNRWLDGTPVIADGRVLLTPVESDRLFGMDLLTGEALWAPILRKSYRYLAGCRDGNFYLVASDSMLAFSLKTGQPSWPVPAVLADGESVSGTGVFGDGVYYLPTTGNAILEIELSTGKILQRRTLKYAAGNLLAVGDSVISQNATHLSLAYAEAPLEKVVSEILSSDPKNRWGMVRKGELLLQAGERDQAIEWLMKARALDFDDEEVRVLLVDALLDAIRAGKDPDIATTELLDQLIEFPPQRVELLRLKVDRSIAQKDALSGVRQLIELSSIDLLEEQLNRGKSARFFDSGANSRASLDAWVASRLETLLSLSTAAERTELEAAVVAHVGPYISEAPSVQRRACSQFGLVLGTDLLRKGLFDAALDEGSWATAERLAIDAVAFGQANQETLRQAEWNLRLADLYTRAGFAADAAYHAQLSEEQGQEIGAPLLQLIAAANATKQWPAGVRLVGRDDSMQGRMPQSQNLPIDVVSRRGLTTRLWLPFVDNRNRSIWIRDPDGIDHPIPFEPGKSQSDLIQATMDGGLMVLLTSQEIVAFDLLSLTTRPVDSILWRRPWQPQSGSRTVTSRSSQEFFDDNRKNYVIRATDGGTVQNGTMRLGPISGRQFFILQGGDLIAIDVITNEELWRATGFPGDAFVVVEDKRVAVVSATSGVKLLRASDGGLIGTESWEPSEMVYMAAGPHVLTAQNLPVTDETQTPDKLIRLRSPVSGKEVLSATIASEPNERKVRAFVRTLGGRHMVLMTALGRLLVWDLYEGRTIADTQVDVSGQLSGIHVIPFDSSLVISAVRRPDRNLERSSQNDVQTQIDYQDGPEHVDTDGPLICLNLSDGTIRWRYTIDGPWGISVNQAGSSPLLVLTRSTRQYISNGKPNRTMDLLAIDMRTGELASRVEKMKIESNFTSISTTTRVMGEINTVDVTSKRYGFSFQFVDEVLPEDQRTVDADTIATQHAESSANGTLGVQPPGLLPLLDGQ